MMAFRLRFFRPHWCKVVLCPQWVSYVIAAAKIWYLPFMILIPEKTIKVQFFFTLINWINDQVNLIHFKSMMYIYNVLHFHFTHCSIWKSWIRNVKGVITIFSNSFVDGGKSLSGQLKSMTWHGNGAKMVSLLLHKEWSRYVE